MRREKEATVIRQHILLSTVYLVGIKSARGRSTHFGLSQKKKSFDSFSSATFFRSASMTDVLSFMTTDMISSTSSHRFRLTSPSPTPHLSLQPLSETVPLLPFTPTPVSQNSRRITKKNSTSGSCRQRRGRNWRRRGREESWNWAEKNE